MLRLLYGCTIYLIKFVFAIPNLRDIDSLLFKTNEPQASLMRLSNEGYIH
jgi:hypothetical protein